MRQVRSADRRTGSRPRPSAPRSAPTGRRRSGRWRTPHPARRCACAASPATAAARSAVASSTLASSRGRRSPRSSRAPAVTLSRTASAARSSRCGGSRRPGSRSTGRDAPRDPVDLDAHAPPGARRVVRPARGPLGWVRPPRRAGREPEHREEHGLQRAHGAAAAHGELAGQDGHPRRGAVHRRRRPLQADRPAGHLLAAGGEHRRGGRTRLPALRRAGRDGARARRHARSSGI